jgi:hypothetical protein
MAKPKNDKLQQGRDLARKLYDIKLPELFDPAPETLNRWRVEHPLLSNAEVEDVRKQVYEARIYQQERSGWQTIPHDLTVIVFALITILFTLKAGVVAGIAVLVLTESLFMVYFSRKIYRPLSFLVWFTYPAYIVLAFVLFQRGMPWYWIAIIVAIAWGGVFFLGMIARLPMQMILRAKTEAAKQKQSNSAPGKK